ncbi:helix-turn-helix transcriptional regulator [Ornithinimicrobium cerasi]|uniref:helix-turn-helix transcriptional regulator n=1 Tax=Ornithinimicrobium cerasi TaxID=2248773 RepID=UPI000EFF8274|nr:LuxR C-terminal-related transcriptional regulator [Ornithinimicrobium cerasi]
MAEVGVTAADLRTLRDILALLRPGHGAGVGPVEVAYEVLDLLEVLLRVDGISFQEMHVGRPESMHRSYVQASVAGEHVALDEEQIAEYDRQNPPDTIMKYWWQLPCSLVDRTGRAQLSTTRMFFSASEWAAHPVQIDYLRCVDSLLLAYPAGGGSSLRILTARETAPAFGLRELTLMELLQPHLLPLLQAVRAEVAGAPARDAAAVLTQRQTEILHLVALGLPNKRIGRMLGISEGTVRKHLEHGFERIGAQSRTEAVHWLHAHESSAAG